MRRNIGFPGYSAEELRWNRLHSSSGDNSGIRAARALTMSTVRICRQSPRQAQTWGSARGTRRYSRPSTCPPEPTRGPARLFKGTSVISKNIQVGGYWPTLTFAMRKQRHSVKDDGPLAPGIDGRVPGPQVPVDQPRHQDTTPRL